MLPLPPFVYEMCVVLSALAVVGIWGFIWSAAPAETVQGRTGDAVNVSGLLQILGSYFGSYDFKE